MLLFSFVNRYLSLLKKDEEKEHIVGSNDYFSVWKFCFFLSTWMGTKVCIYLPGNPQMGGM